MTDSGSTLGEEGAASSTESKPNFRRELETRARDAEQRNADLEQRLASYERRDVFRSAGLDPDDKRINYFVKAYEGELDVEAIRHEATAAGFLDQMAPTPEAAAMMDNAFEGEQRIMAAGEGGDPVSQTDLDARIKATKNPQELRALMEGEGYLWGATA
jgi:ribosomal protein L12E/L44/L45/RPP1/RPP2